MDQKNSIKVESFEAEPENVQWNQIQENQGASFDGHSENKTEIKTEPMETDWYSALNLYVDHQVKEEIVIGPTELLKQNTGTLNYPINPEPEFPCTICQKTYKIKNSLSKHMRTKHDIPKTSEKKTSKSNKEKLRKNAKKIENRKGEFVSIMCGLCFKYFTTVSSLQRHMKICPKLRENKNIGNKKEVVIKKGKLVDIKEKVTKQEKIVIKQENLVTKQEKLVTKNEIPIIENKEKYDRDTKIDDNNSKIKCNLCSKTFTFTNNLNRHIKQFHMKNVVEKAYSCDICHMKFSRNDYLTRHKLIKHLKEKKEGTVLNCECGKKFFDKWRFRKHIKAYCTVLAPVTEEVFCDYCNKSYFNKYRLIDHIRLHLKKLNKKLICDYCKKVFHKKYDISRHMFQHLMVDLKRYKCRICFKIFIRHWSLKKHMIAHSGRKPFSCKFCGRRFGSKWGCLCHEKHCHLLPK